MPVVSKLKELSKVTLPTRAGQTAAPTASATPAAPGGPPTGGLTVEQLIRALQRDQRSAA
jgi:hypothetical protein